MDTHFDQSIVELLQPFANVLNDDFDRYWNHCRRVARYFDHFVGGRWPIPAADFAVLLAYHDLTIWTHRTFDYLGPSQDLTREYLERAGRTEHATALLAAIDNHHKITTYTGPGRELVEPFRRADWTDVTGGWRSFGIPRARVRAVEAEVPVLRFRKRLVDFARARAKAKPLSPLPLLRW